MLAVQTVTGTGNVVTGNQARPWLPVSVKDMVSEIFMQRQYCRGTAPAYTVPMNSIT